MKKFYKIFLLIISLVFLTTYNPNKFNENLENNNTFFKIEKIIISNNFLVKEEEIISKLKPLYRKNILLIRRKDIEESLKNIIFLKKIEVKKKYPHTIIVKIFETEPVGILFKDKEEYLLDSSANLIEIENKKGFTGLPNIIGNDAENNIINFLDKLKTNKFPINNIKKFSYFKIGRWDVELLDDRAIKFPYNVDSKIIKKTIELLSRKDFQNYKIIDLRIDGKIIVE
jgi:cell division septal protein FtsQ